MTNSIYPILTTLLTDGSGNANSTVNITGVVYGVEIQGTGYSSGTLLIESISNGILETIITTSVNQDIVLYPRKNISDSSGSLLLTNSTYPTVNESVKVSISGGGVAETGDIYLYMLKDT